MRSKSDGRMSFEMFWLLEISLLTRSSIATVFSSNAIQSRFAVFAVCVLAGPSVKAILAWLADGLKTWRRCCKREARNAHAWRAVAALRSLKAVVADIATLAENAGQLQSDDVIAAEASRQLTPAKPSSPRNP